MLQRIGWQPFFAQQISVDEMALTPPVRVTEVHRSGLRVLGDGIDMMVPPRADAHRRRLAAARTMPSPAPAG